ncbi:MAG TPA: hypothetical protein VGD46_18660 [Rhizobacter sp.]
MNAQAILDKIQSGRYRIVQAVGARRFTLERLHKAQWLVGVTLNTNAAKAACARLSAQHGVHLTIWQHPEAVTPTAA